MSKIYILFWQAFSLPIAYIVTNVYLNIGNYVVQLDKFFHVKFLFNLPESWFLALIIFLAIFIFPNFYVFISLHFMKKDFINRKIQQDIHIKPYEQYIEINNMSYTIRDTLDNQLICFILVSVLSFIINYSSLILLLLYSVTLIIISMVYVEGSLIVINPYLRFKYNIFILRSGDKTLYIIMEKEKEFERPRFSEYVIDWYYDHFILIGFKDIRDKFTFI
ncbi:hypothetical protein SBFV1_gp08 [Sulfolobales Beppu filamentous phage 1]|uniref:Uncharacterized protein n=1 Tax=Sulfolobales Beppu filamentous phage 1 TaxID=2493122 RepID=A0A3Q8Q902_9VIRU|nr:hypothetical protein SBFV1_gp08 [Sulfolobales Beppu filamentous phage 1]